MKAKIDIRKIMNNDEMNLVNELEMHVWKGEGIAAHQKITAADNGGLVLGAFNEEKLVGFSYSFAGFYNGQTYLCSHSLGIHPDYQVLGIGSKLKEEQKKIALEMGYQLISWTYDPLETRNAYLNLSKLRAVCHTYKENYYGQVDDGLNRGLPTDRFKIEWWIDSDHVNENPTIDIEQTYTHRWEMTEDHLPSPIAIDEEMLEAARKSLTILIPIPTHFQELKKNNIQLAIDWRLKTRDIFKTLFENGYSAVELKKSETYPVHFYVLVKRDSLKIGKIQFADKKV